MIEEHLGLPQLSTGELFRQQMQRQTLLGKTVSRYVTAGLLVPDELVVKVMTRQLATARTRRGYVLDGFPRTAGQAKGLDAYLEARGRPLHGAIFLACTPSVLIERLSGRRVCARCGANYHLRNVPPKRPGVCDRCAGPLVTRADDQVQTIRKRLEVDHAKAKPLLGYYRARRLLYRLNGDGSGLQVYRRAQRLFERQSWLSEVGAEPATPAKAARRTAR